MPSGGFSPEQLAFIERQKANRAASSAPAAPSDSLSAEKLAFMASASVAAAGLAPRNAPSPFSRTMARNYHEKPHGDHDVSQKELASLEREFTMPSGDFSPEQLAFLERQKGNGA